jgi:hypothetical protein
MDATASASAAATLDPNPLQQRLFRGANWFFWIAALSLVNTAMAMSNEDRSFLLGLGVTQLADAIANVGIKQGAPEALRWVAVAFDVIVAGLFTGAGILARRRAGWAFATGMVLYALDGVLCGAIQAWPSLAFHALALYFMWQGFSALRQLRAVVPAPAPAVGPRPNPLVR